MPLDAPNLIALGVGMILCYWALLYIRRKR
jgi:hypothetical protein